jgi:hypothetical protein
MLCVSTRYMRQGRNSPKSGTMEPITTADSKRHRASKREKGRTAAAWEMVNGINKPWLSSHVHITDLYIEGYVLLGWKRIVVTVGERIGKTHLTYAQGASAEIVAMATIGAAEMYGLPVSTTHVLSSGVAGTMVANKSGLQWATVRNLLMAWVLTLPVSIALAGGLYWLLRNFL